MKVKEILKNIDPAIDKIVKIQGTNYDRRRKITYETIEKMHKMYNKGYSYKQIAEFFNTSVRNVRYNLDNEYRKEYNKKYPGSPTPFSRRRMHERVAYKRNLVYNKKKVILSEGK